MTSEDKAIHYWHFKTRDVSLENSLEWAVATADPNRLLFTMRLAEGRGKKRFAPPGVEDNVQRLFGKYVLESFWASKWPGTRLFEHKGRVWVLKFNEEVKTLVLKTQPNFAMWYNNASLPLPEDICVFREGSPRPAILTVTHEGDGWFCNSDKPRLPKLREDRQVVEFIPSGKYFCES